MKNVVNYILSAQKKIFVVAFLAVFSSFYTMVWGAVEYSYNSTTKTLTINKAGVFASGVLPDYSDASIDKYAPWKSLYQGSATQIVIADGITYIGIDSENAKYNVQNVIL